MYRWRQWLETHSTCQLVSRGHRKWDWQRGWTCWTQDYCWKSYLPPYPSCMHASSYCTSLCTKVCAFSLLTFWNFQAVGRSHRCTERVHDSRSFMSTVLARHTLVWKGVLVAMFFSVQLQISRRQCHRSAWNFAWWYISIPDRSLLGWCPQWIPQVQILAIWLHISQNRLSRSVICELELNITSMRAFKKCKSLMLIVVGPRVDSARTHRLERSWRWTVDCWGWSNPCRSS